MRLSAQKMLQIYLQTSFVLKGIWRLTKTEDLAALAAEKQRKLRIRSVWLNKIGRAHV